MAQAQEGPESGGDDGRQQEAVRHRRTRQGHRVPGQYLAPSSLHSARDFLKFRHKFDREIWMIWRFRPWAVQCGAGFTQLFSTVLIYGSCNEALFFFSQVKIAAMTVNGSGPATPWMEEVTYAADLDESAVPDTPSSLKAKVGDAPLSHFWPDCN